MADRPEGFITERPENPAVALLERLRQAIGPLSIPGGGRSTEVAVPEWLQALMSRIGRDPGTQFAPTPLSVVPSRALSAFEAAFPRTTPTGARTGALNSTTLREPNMSRPMTENWVRDPQGAAQLYLGAGREQPLPWIEYASTAPNTQRQGAMSNLVLRSLRQAGGKAMLGAPDMSPGMVEPAMASLLRSLEDIGLISTRTLPTGKRIAELTPAGLEFPHSTGQR